MKHALSLLLILGLSSAAWAQKQVRLEEVDKHIGDSVTITGKVYSGRFFPHGQGAPTLLNIGATYPNQLLTLVIRGTARKEFPGVPEKDLLEKEVKVSGRLELYRGKPQMIVHSTRQLTVTEPAPAETQQ